MRRLLLALAVAVGVVVLLPAQSYACTCVGRTPAQQAHAARSIGSGTVEWRSDNGIEATYSVKFDAVYKGSLARREKVLTTLHSAACGLDLPVDRRYLFFVDGTHRGVIRANSCGGTSPWSAALVNQVVQVTGPAHQPVGDTATAPVVVRSSGSSWWWPYGTGLVAVAIGWVVIDLGRRRLRRTPGEIDARNR